MSGYESNVYYHPEKHGLKPIAEFEYSSGSYEFDTRVIWRHTSGQLYMARDSGCSCPTPFEDYQGVTDLEPFDLSVIERELRDESTGDYRYITPQQAGEWMDALRVELNKPYSIVLENQVVPKIADGHEGKMHT